MKWRLEDSKGRTIKIVEAADRATADIVGFTKYPGKYQRAVDLEAEEAKAEAGLVVLQESFERSFLREGKAPEEAKRMAEIAARGKGR